MGREIEVQTHCDVSIKLKPTWKDGKTWEYKSDRVVNEKEEAPPQLPTAISIVASPRRDIQQSPIASTKNLSIQMNAEFVGRQEKKVFGLAVATKTN